MTSTIDNEPEDTAGDLPQVDAVPYTWYRVSARTAYERSSVFLVPHSGTAEDLVHLLLNSPAEWITQGSGPEMVAIQKSQIFELSVEEVEEP